MKLSSFLLAASASAAAGQAVNPFEGKSYFVNPEYSDKLNETVESFLAANDTLNAARTRTIQEVGTFVWVSSVANLPNIDAAIEQARAVQEETGEEQIIGLVHYNLPNRDCSGGESSGEFDLDKDGLNRYKAEYVEPFAEAVASAPELSFAVVLEPDSLGNAVTNTGIEFCNASIPAYKEGIAYAISQLQMDNVALYVDAAHGGWLGWDDNLEPTAAIVAEVVGMASANATIRGLAINVSNYNEYRAPIREAYTEFSNSWDEFHFVNSLVPHLEDAGVPAQFIVDQGRVASPGAREEWGEWCNVSPSGYGMRPTTETDNPNVDSIVWIKPGGESDGECGLEGAPAAGLWFNEFVENLVKNARPCITPSWGPSPLPME